MAEIWRMQAQCGAEVIMDDELIRNMNDDEARRLMEELNACVGRIAAAAGRQAVAGIDAYNGERPDSGR